MNKIYFIHDMFVYHYCKKEMLEATNYFTQLSEYVTVKESLFILELIGGNETTYI